MKTSLLSRAILAAILSLALLPGCVPAVRAAHDGPARGNSYASPVDKTVAIPSGWSFEVAIYNPGSRSEYTISTLDYCGMKISESVQHAITPIGEFVYVRGPEDNWKPTESPGWERTMKQPELNTGRAKVLEIECSPSDRERGWYLGGFDARRGKTPDDWFYAPEYEAWLDPGRRERYEALIAAKLKLAKLVEAAREFRRRVGDTPGDLDLLVSGPQDEKNWTPIVTRDQLIDPWGRPFEIENFARIHARTEGRDFAIRSKGPDGIEGSGDDLDAPKPVNPKPSPFEGLLMR